MEERTFVIFKPDCMEKRLLPDVLARLTKPGFKIAALKMARLGDEILAEHYAHIVGKPYYPPLVDFMKRAPVVMAVLEGSGAVGKVRSLLGPTNSQEAPAGTIRGDFGENTRENICHASDSPENAEIEIARFFKPEEIF